MASKDLKVLLGLRQKTLAVSKGALFSDPLEVLTSNLPTYVKTDIIETGIVADECCPQTGGR